jgi:putative heme-binding domain-containing protein
MRLGLGITLIAVAGVFLAVFAWPRPAPFKLAPGWDIELLAQAPAILYPTAIVAANDGTIYLGQDPMDMPGPPTQPADSVIAIKDGRFTVFAEKLWAVMGLEWSDGTLYVVHAPYLSAFRDTDGDGKADQRVDLVTSLGPAVPAFNGMNDHIASGIRLGIDGFLYIAVGDKGIPRATGRDGKTIRLHGGGVIRVRPDGTDLEVVSTGERNPLSVALDAHDEIFSYGNDDDSKQWPNSLTHHIFGGHYGYPYEFKSAPSRALPILDGRVGGAGAQGICYNEDGLAERFPGSLFFCDWGLSSVIRYELEKHGGSFKVKTREYIVRKGTMTGFRPFSLAVSEDRRSLYLVDWGFDGFLADGPKTGRLFRLTYTGRDRTRPSPRPTSASLGARLTALDHPARSVRIENQRALAASAAESERALLAKLKAPGRALGRLHALWALDAIGTAGARSTIRQVLGDPDEQIRTQAARSCGIRRDHAAQIGLERALADESATVRRESAISLARLGDACALPALLTHLDEDDRCAAWSIRQAIRAIGTPDVAALAAALVDPERRAGALALCDQWRSVISARALALALRSPAEPAWRAKLTATIAGLYRQYPEWSGGWFGPNPLAGEPPRPTEDWDPAGMATVQDGLARALDDPDSSVRQQALKGLFQVGAPALPRLRDQLGRESDPANLALLARALGALGDRAAIGALARLLAAGKNPGEVTAAALEALATLGGPEADAACRALARNPETPAPLLARALATPRAGAHTAAELRGFLDHNDPCVRTAALRGLATCAPPAGPAQRAVIARLDDRSPEVRAAAISLVAALKLREAVPRLIELAGDTAVRPQAIQALAALPDSRALPVYLGAIGALDPELRRLGETGLCAIRDLVEQDLSRRLRSGAISGPAAQAIERALERFVPVIHWRVIGPFPKNTPRRFVASTALDFGRVWLGAGGRPVAWEPRQGEPSTGRVVFDCGKSGDFASEGSGYDASASPDLAVFAFAAVDTDKERSALLRAGSSGTMTVWLNGTPVVHSDHVSGRPYAPDSDVVPVTLKQGTNRILVESRQGIGSWSFGVQLSESANSGRLVPASGRVREALRACAMVHRGDARRGKRLFFDPNGIGCARCHAVGGKGMAGIGPDLTGLANQYDRAEIIRSVLEPSSRIANGFQPVVLAKTDGTVLTGILRAESETELALLGFDLQPMRVLKSEVELRRTGETSLMPAGLVDLLTPSEFADLIAYLGSLTK